MQFKAFEAGIEISGRSTQTVIDAFGTIHGIPQKFFFENGIGEKTPNGSIKIHPERWYPQAAWLRAFECIAKEVGETTLYRIGAKIPASRPLPPDVVDLEGAIKSLDVIYHLSHRKYGQAMLDHVTGKLLEGIGHYTFKAIAKRTFACVCSNPYPCEFDLGLVTGMAKKFEKFATVTHEAMALCRKNGDESCTYVIKW